MFINRSRKSQISKDKIPDEQIRGEICIFKFNYQSFVNLNLDGTNVDQ